MNGSIEFDFEKLSLIEIITMPEFVALIDMEKDEPNNEVMSRYWKIIVEGKPKDNCYELYGRIYPLRKVAFFKTK